MSRSRAQSRFAIVLLLVSSAVLLPRSQTVAGAEPVIELYVAEVTADQLRELLASGFDVAIQGDLGDRRYAIELGLSALDQKRLLAQMPSLRPSPWRAPDGTPYRRWLASQAEQGYRVWRSWDEPGGIRDEIDALVRQYGTICQKIVLGQSVQGRDVVAVRVTAGAPHRPLGERPAVLYVSLQHAREWLTVEVNRRLLRYLLEHYEDDPQVRELLATTELWFVLVANPDGYEFSFEPDHRLWRKNLRDNDGDGRITEMDGVDLNRNFDSHWGYDEDGSSGLPYSDGYRGPRAASEPETQALQKLVDEVHFAFMVNYHSAAGLILYPIGWQRDTEAVDHPVLVALAGTRQRPAIAGFRPGLSADLYITNGETCDYALQMGTLCFTPELTPAPSGSVFVFPDDEALVAEEFARNLPFALDVARSAVDPARPVSHLGNTTEPFYVNAFRESYGDPQLVQVDAARYLGEVRLKYRIGAGPVQSRPTFEWPGGERYGDVGDIAYRRLRGLVEGAKPGDEVTVWFEAGHVSSPAFTYRRVPTRGSRVLIVAAEDYTGAWPEYARKDEPTYLSDYLQAVADAGMEADVYDVDAHQRTAPSLLGVLRHYDVVVWYTGDDFATAPVGTPAGSSSRLAKEMMVVMRDYLNEGGRLLVAGRWALQQYAWGLLYNPEGDLPCPGGRNPDPCVNLSDDFARYYLGADLLLENAGTSAAGMLHPVVGIAPPFAGLRLHARRPANGSDHSQSFRVTSARMAADRFPQFASWAAAHYQRPGERPRSGDYAVYAGRATYSHVRWSREIDLADRSEAELRFWLAYDIRSPWDAVFVEVHRLNRDDWTTLPDRNGHTTSEAALNCAYQEWFRRYPHLAHYMSVSGPSDRPSCEPRGATGEWNAASGSSSGDWQEWVVDLSAYAGERIEVAISFVSSRVPYYGVLVDDVTLPDGELNSFEQGDDGWRASAPPENESTNSVSFRRTAGVALPPPSDAAIVVTSDSVLLGFDLSSLASRAERAEVMRRSLAHLLPRAVVALPYLARP